MLPAGLVAVAAMVRPKATFWSVSPAAHDKEVGIQLLGQGYDLLVGPAHLEVGAFSLRVTPPAIRKTAEQTSEAGL
jgi:hypothetical protein